MCSKSSYSAELGEGGGGVINQGHVSSSSREMAREPVCAFERESTIQLRQS